VDASAAQKRPVTKTCLQCSAVLPSSVRVCNFCDSSLTVDLSSEAGISAPGVSGESGSHIARTRPQAAVGRDSDPAWRGELSQRLQAYRVRRRRVLPNHAQSKLPFEEPTADPPVHVSVGVAEPPAMAEEDFAFTIAIGRNAARVKKPGWSLTYPCQRPRGRASNKHPQATFVPSRPACIQWPRSMSAELPD